MRRVPLRDLAERRRAVRGKVQQLRDAEQARGRQILLSGARALQPIYPPSFVGLAPTMKPRDVHDAAMMALDSVSSSSGESGGGVPGKAQSHSAASMFSCAATCGRWAGRAAHCTHGGVKRRLQQRIGVLEVLHLLALRHVKVLWCGVVWCGVVWCGVVWCGDLAADEPVHVRADHLLHSVRLMLLRTHLDELLVPHQRQLDPGRAQRCMCAVRLPLQPHAAGSEQAACSRAGRACARRRGAPGPPWRDRQCSTRRGHCDGERRQRCIERTWRRRRGECGRLA